MVKGVSRQVVVVRCPDARFFDQAIFLLREDVVGAPGSDRVLREACRAADDYIRENVQRRLVPRLVWILGGVVLALGAAAAAVLL